MGFEFLGTTRDFCAAQALVRSILAIQVAVAGIAETRCRLGCLASTSTWMLRQTWQ